MAIYRNIHVNFWEDAKVLDEMNIEERYFWLYLLTNPHTNQIGCFEISKRQMKNETDFDSQKITQLLEKFENELELIIYSTKTKEIFIKNWHKYNWNKSPKVRVCVEKEFLNIKDENLKAKIYEMLTKTYGFDTLSIQYKNGMYSLGIQEEEEEEENKNKNNNKNKKKNNMGVFTPPTSATPIFNFLSSTFEKYEKNDLKRSAKKFFEFYEKIKWKNVDDWQKKAKEWFEEDIQYKNLEEEESLDDRVKEIFGDN